MRTLVLILAFAHVHAHAMESVFNKEFRGTDRFEVVTTKTVTAEPNETAKPKLVASLFWRNTSRACVVRTLNGPYQRTVIPAGTRVQIVQYRPFVGSKIFDDMATADLMLVDPSTGNELGVVSCGTYAIWQGQNMFNLTLNVTMGVLGATVVGPEIKDVLSN